MLFKNKSMSVDYMPSKQIEKYLVAKLKKLLGYEYTVYIRLKISKNWLDISIDETSMTDEMYEALMAFMEQYDLLNHEEVFEQILKIQHGSHCLFKFLVDDLEGAYVIREN